MAQQQLCTPPAADISYKGKLSVEELKVLPSVELEAIPKYFDAGARQWPTRDIGAYEVIKKVGQGAYGSVYAARDKVTGEMVALKQITPTPNKLEHLQLTTLREIRNLQLLSCAKGGIRHILKLTEVVRGTDDGQGGKTPGGSNSPHEDLYMVLEYMDHDLTGLASKVEWKFSVPEVKCIMKMILKGLTMCHKINILHRDLKMANLLLTKSGTLKIADFGLSRVSNNGEMTPGVVTLWYRAPELLMAGKKYSSKVDIWSVGCIFAELLTGRALFPGNSETEMLDFIFRTTGFPTEERWSKVKEVVAQDRFTMWKKHYYDDKKYQKNRLEASLRQMLKETRKELYEVLEGAIPMIVQMLDLDPERRPSAYNCLRDDNFKWLWDAPYACEPHDLRGLDTASHHWEMQPNAAAAAQPAAAAPQQAQHAGARATGNAPAHHSSSSMPPPKRSRTDQGPSQQGPSRYDGHNRRGSREDQHFQSRNPSRLSHDSRQSTHTAPHMAINPLAPPPQHNYGSAPYHDRNAAGGWQQYGNYPQHGRQNYGGHFGGRPNYGDNRAPLPGGPLPPRPHPPKPVTGNPLATWHGQKR